MTFDFDRFVRQGAAGQGYNATTSGDTSGLDAFAKTHSDFVDPKIYDTRPPSPVTAPTSSGPDFSGAGTLGLNLLKGAGQKFQDFSSMLAGGSARPWDQPQDASSVVSNVSNTLGLGGALRALGTAGSLVQAPLGLPSLLSGDPRAKQAALEAYKTEGGDTPSVFDVPAVARSLTAARESQAGTFGKIAEDTSQGFPTRALAGAAQFATGALPNVAPLPFLPKTGSPRVATKPLALPAPAETLALPAGTRAATGFTRDGGPFGAPVGQGPFVKDLPPIVSPEVRPGGAPIPQTSPVGRSWLARGSDVQAGDLTANGKPAIVDTTARPVEPATPATDSLASWKQQIADSIARQKADTTPIDYSARAPANLRDARLQAADVQAPITLADLRARIGANTSDTATVAPSLRDRVGPLTAVGREDLAGKFAKPADVPPLSLADIKARIGAKPTDQWAEGVPLNAEQISARIGAKSRPQADVAQQLAGEVEARQQKATGTLGASGMSGPMVGRAIGRGGSQLDRALRTGNTPEDLNASLVRQAKVHDANEAAISATRDALNAPNGHENWPAVEKALRNVALLGGDLNHTASRLRAAGLPGPTRAQIAEFTKAGPQSPASSLGGKNVQPTTGTGPQVPARGLGRNFLKEEGGSTTVGGALGPFGRLARDNGGTLPGNSRITMADIARKAENATGVGKTLTTAASPFHFMFRHALPAMVAHPQAWAKGSVKGLGEGFTMTPAQLAKRQQVMHDNLVRNGYGDVYIGRPHLGSVGGEESVASSWVNKIPVLGKVIERSGQGFVQGLNEVRYEMVKGVNDFNVAMAKKGLVEPMSMADRKSMAETINTFTGRGIDTNNMGDAGKATVRALNVTMFSPQMAAARVKMLGYTAKGMADVLNNVRQGKPVDAVALERARLGIGAMSGIGLMYALMTAAGGKLDTNPVSTTAGQVDIGKPGPLGAAAGFAASETGMGFSAYPGKNAMVNPTESEAGLIRTIARLAVAIHDQATGSKDLQKMEGAKQETTPMDVATRYALTQMFSSPLTYPLAQFLQGYAVEPLGAVTPMPVSAALTGAGVEMPTIGGKPPAAPKAPSKSAPTTRPGASLLRTAHP